MDKVKEEYWKDYILYVELLRDMFFGLEKSDNLRQLKIKHRGQPVREFKATVHA